VPEVSKGKVYMNQKKHVPIGIDGDLLNTSQSMSTLNNHLYVKSTSPKINPIKCHPKKISSKTCRDEKNWYSNFWD